MLDSNAICQDPQMKSSSRAIQGTNDLEQMMSDVLDTGCSSYALQRAKRS